MVKVLQRIDPSGGPTPGDHNFWRGVPLAMRDENVREAMANLQNDIDTNLATLAWEAALKAPIWGKDPVWIHGDLLAGNLLINQGRFMCNHRFWRAWYWRTLHVTGYFAWSLLSVKTREKLRKELSVDEATWERGRGWALSVGLIALSVLQNQ